MKNNHTKQWLPAMMQILGCAVFMLALLAGVPDARAGIASDNAFLLDPFDPVPEIQFRHHGGYSWGNYCGYNPCHRRHYNRCYRNCYGYSRCSRDCGGYRNECYGDRCNRHDGYRQGGYDGCRGDNCYRERRHDGCRGDGCRDREIYIEKRQERYDEQADRYDDQSEWYERRYMDRRRHDRDRWDHDRYRD